MSTLFTPWSLPSANGQGLTLHNRVVIAPMCQYSAVDGAANDWHLTHWTNMLNGGAGMFIIEATAVTRDGRISPGCLGLWDTQTEAALRDNLQRARAQAPATPVCIQLSHAGRKGSSAAPWHGGALIAPSDGGWVTKAPSALAHAPGEAEPQALSQSDIDDLVQAFVSAAQRAQAMGIDAVELHAAHGYLMHQFLSPLANLRTDAYGGDFSGRTRFVREVFAAVRQVFHGPLGVRISATDWVEGGWTPEETVQLCALLRDLGADFAHISTAGVSPLQKIPAAPGFQLPFAQQVKAATGMTTIGVGLITEAAQAEAALNEGMVDLVAVARAVLFNPRWVWAAAAQLGGQVPASSQYLRSLPGFARHIFGDVRIGMR
jgi:2,4-dienoyl-CoA reductase-like NADH-dependent reductase (Old Yellow Enzyme family)